MWSSASESAGATSGMQWLTRPLKCKGDVILSGLELEHLTNGDMREICLRMHAIFHTIEMPRCEERLMPIDIFDRMETLGDVVVSNGLPPRLKDWLGLIKDFGNYYGLNEESGPIVVDATYYVEAATQFSIRIH